MDITKVHIDAVKRTDNADKIFSILIPSWNNLPYLKLCIESIRKNSTYPNQLIVHINDGADGSLEWVKSQPDIDYSYSSENIGVCYALNSCRRLADTNYLLYLNDDMYVCPSWDKFLYDEIVAIGHEYFFLSATAIEPRAQSNCSIEYDFGKDVSAFDEKQLLENYHRFEMADWSGATWPPNVVHKNLWDMVGGYSIEFNPGMYSDPDFSKKLWQMGVRYFKGLAASRVYHFGSVSVQRVKKNKGYYAFISKWGFTSGTFSKKFLKRGERFSGPLLNQKLGMALLLKNAFKQVVAVFARA